MGHVPGSLVLGTPGIKVEDTPAPSESNRSCKEFPIWQAGWPTEASVVIP
jgi:hypothetical protein